MVTLQSAYQAYQDFFGRKVAFSTFAALRPKNVRRLGSVPVDTCLCVTCTNVKLKIDSLNRVLGPAERIVAEGKLFNFLLCPYKGQWPSKDCISGECLRCHDRIRPFTTKCWDHFFTEVKWFHLERREMEGRMKLDIHPYHGTVCELLEQLHRDLNAPTKGTTFLRHLFTAYWQQSQYDISKESLKKGQVLMVQDFAENRKATYHAEVKSAHFGKAQVSLHPSVCFYKDGLGQLVRHVFMFFSDDIGHDYHAVHHFTDRAVSLLEKETCVKEVILWSDGAASQYKGKGSFADLSLYPYPVQRNFFGSEHGKGEADGETGRFSQAMSRAVAGGQCFRHAKDMVDFGMSKYESTGLKKYSFVLVDNIERERPHTEVSTLPGSRSLHQILKKGRYILAARKLSCFCSGCGAGQLDCCINKEHVGSFDIFKLKPSDPQPEPQAAPEVPEETDDEPQEEPIVFSNTEYPQVGDWLEIIGSVEVKKARVDKSFFANVVSPPDGTSGALFVHFFTCQHSGSYVRNTTLFQIVPGTVEDYRWRSVPAPLVNARGHYFFKI